MRRLAGLAACFSAVFLCACLGSKEEIEVTDAAHRVKSSDLSEEDARTVTFVRRVVDEFTNLSAARAAGYTQQYPAGCMQTKSAAQGYHFLNPLLLDDRVELNRPELLMYEPQFDQSLTLVGVDYLVPLDKWNSKDPPQLIGRHFVRNDSLKAWTLHIWTHRDNPNGVFAMYNPNVVCRTSR